MMQQLMTLMWTGKVPEGYSIFLAMLDLMVSQISSDPLADCIDCKVICSNMFEILAAVYFALQCSPP